MGLIDKIVLRIKWIMVLLSTVVGHLSTAAYHIWKYRNKHYIIFYELIGVILVGIGVAMIYLPLAFVVGGLAVLILTQAEENK